MLPSSTIRKMCDLMDRHDGLFKEHDATIEWYGIRFYLYPDYEDDKPVEGSVARKMADISRAMRRDTDAQKTPVEKASNEYTYCLTVVMNGYKVKVEAARDNVCKKVETDEMEEVEVVDWANTPKVKEMRPVTRWECAPILSDI